MLVLAKKNNWVSSGEERNVAQVMTMNPDFLEKGFTHTALSNLSRKGRSECSREMNDPSV